MTLTGKKVNYVNDDASPLPVAVLLWYCCNASNIHSFGSVGAGRALQCDSHSYHVVAGMFPRRLLRIMRRLTYNIKRNSQR